ncbi:hypothetical protein [Flavobacterium aurantiibacter]|uniref:Uncharacterized protein n=1 Tax=Flavobacterium aurantiibacter TaxID=2023067 RepID=A0A255ZXG3_9FLAO|nr:hypothetical protein [Flavobacterium aurantiibacter]OYQ46082.1 hypothetical protein CHX27_05055 [Flavobacterium aurantiibacter]
MDTRINKIILYVCSIVNFISCRSVDKKVDYRKVYVDEFKITYFKKCLQYGFNTHEILLLNENDGSQIVEPILGNYSQIDSIAKNKILKEVREFQREVATRAEGANKIPVYKICLCQYESKEIDSLANEFIDKILPK